MAGAHPIELESFTTSSAALVPPSATASTDPLTKGNAGRRASKAYEDPYGLVDAAPRADTRVRESNAVVLWFRQLGVMLRNNFTLTVRAAPRRRRRMAGPPRASLSRTAPHPP